MDGSEMMALGRELQLLHIKITMKLNRCFERSVVFLRFASPLISFHQCINLCIVHHLRAHALQKGRGNNLLLLTKSH